MYSDEWIKLGYTSCEQIEVSDIAFYRTWTDNAGAEIGATVDFEIDNDFHYDMPISEWLRFLNNVLHVDESDDVTMMFRNYFVRNKGLFDFERDLRMNGIEYQKIAFY